MTPDEISPRLEAYISSQAGSPATVGDLRPLAGGASRAAYALDIDLEDGSTRRAAVLRLDLGGKIYESTLTRLEEYRLLAHVRTCGVRVPEVYWASADPEVLGRDFLIMERVDGETIGRKIVKAPALEAARRHLPVQLGEELARIHGVDREPLDFLPRPRPGESPAESALRRCRVELDRVEEPHPALEIGFRWLERHAPEAADPVLVHGDYRLGNIIVGDEGLRAVLDWEFTAIGDPHEDLAWPFVRDWRFGNDDRRFSGLSDGADFLAAYEKASDRAVDPVSLRYWEVMGNFRWALGCLTQARRHLSGDEPSVELASLGRRCAEMELEMMELIEAIEA